MKKAVNGTELGNCRRYLARKLLRTRRSLIRAYRAACSNVRNGSASLSDELLSEEFYTVEKQIIQGLNELEEQRRIVLPLVEGGEPRIFREARRLASSDSFKVDGSFINAELRILPLCVRISILLRIDGIVSEGADEKELKRALDSLKKLSDLDWDEVIAEASPIVRELGKDEGWSLLDRESRNLLVESTERIAKSLEVPEQTVARKAAELPREAAYYLAAEGESELRKAIAGNRAKQPLRPIPAYVIFITAFRLLTLALSAILLKKDVPTALIAVFPCSLIALSAVTALFTLAFKPRRIPRLEITNANGEFKTAVAVPVLLTDEEAADEAVNRLETHYLSDPLDGAEYVLLADLPDAKTKELKTDAGIAERARKGIDALNAKYGERFYFIIRERTQNRDGVWQGQERKRGAVTELMRLLSGGTSAKGTVHPEAKLRAKYLVVLDADTVLPPDTLRKLIGAAAHPANKPVIKNGRVISGYSVFAPRMRTTAESASATFFSRVFSGDTGYELYSCAVSSLHFDAFREGDFGGKGIINIRPFLELTEGRIPDNRVLSHDLLEGSFARCAFLDDVVLYDGEPSTLPKWWKRQERWIRGDWQLVPFILGKGLSVINRTKMLGNLLRSLREPVTMLLLTAALALGSTPLFAVALTAFVFEPLKGFILLALSNLRERSAQDGFIKLLLRTAIELFSLPYAAVKAFAAITAALFRTLISHRKMLLWQTAASSRAGEGGVLTANLAVSALFVSGAVAKSFLSGFGAAEVFALLLSLLWAVGPFAVRRADAVKKPLEKKEADMAFIKMLTEKAWDFFLNECGERTGFLPPDNIQEYPETPAADVTSPTDVGMGMMALVSAHDLKLVSDEEFVNMAREMLSSIEQLEKWHGIPFNWYRVSDRSVLRPRFVSSVDAGNLAASLMVLGEALGELGEEASIIDKLLDEMDLSALFDGKRRLFHIGFDADEGRLTPSCYDLYASEARLLSFVAIALRKTPLAHWNALSRIMRDAVGGRTLVSWSGTAFEYLMPLIFFETAEGSLQHEIALSAVRTQFIKETGSTPWGRSESGYCAFDRAMRYQYRAFGEPSLALEPKRDGMKVVAPYAAALALYSEPEEAVLDIKEFVKLGAVGKYGLFEAVDYGRGVQPRIVRSFMAHHKGMELCACAAYLTGNLNAKRFMGIARVRACSQLLFENLPLKPVVIRAYEASVGRAPSEDTGKKELSRSASAFTLDGVLLSNGSRSTHIFTDGKSVSRLGDVLLTDDVSITVGGARVSGECLLEPHRAVFTEVRNGVLLKESVVNASVLPAEIRVLTLVNRTAADVNLSVTASFRPVMANEREYRAHPAFLKLTVDAKERDGAVLFRLRKKRGRRELRLYAALIADGEMSCTTEDVRIGKPESSTRPVEPRFSAVTKIALAPSEKKEAVFIMGAAERETDALKQLSKLRKSYAEEESMSRLVASGIMREAGVRPEDAVGFEPLIARIERRAPFKQLTSDRAAKGVKKLWELGISGDKPIVAVTVDSPEELDDMVRFASFCRYASIKGLSADYCVLSSLPTDYGDPARTKLGDILRGVPNVCMLDRRDIPEDSVKALISNALIAVKAGAVPYAPLLKRRGKTAESMPLDIPGRRALAFDNGFGGFDTEREEYVICSEGPTPAPWSNILANTGFGTLVTENGGGYTWCGNSRLLRLTPWDCCSVEDKVHERVMLTENGLSMNLVPCGLRGKHEVLHGLGYTRFFCSSLGLEAELTLFVDSERPVKYYMVSLANRTDHPRSVGLSLDIDWAIGEEPHPESLIFSEEDGVVFVDSARREDDGRRAFVSRSELSLTVFGGETETAVFVMGMDLPERARTYINELTRPDTAGNELEKVKAVWKKRLSVLEVKTGDAAFDMLVNRLLLYQTFASRLLAKTGYYQSGGAVGFRDRLQDALAFLLTEPGTVRGIILDSAAHQFKEGDVLHWWHGAGTGVRTRISDDRLFLPLVAAEYARVTGDASIWDESVTYLEGEPLSRMERDRYAEFRAGDKSESVFSHCLRAIEISMKLGKNGLPLMGSGDWNDGFDEVGGESVFNGFLLLKTLDSFIPVCRERDGEKAAELVSFGNTLRESLERTWEGDRYLRAIRWDGAKLGSKDSDECSIDLISAVWAVFCGMEHAAEAFDTALSELLDSGASVLKLLSPPFTDTSPVSAGYIEAYCEGMRENGGQYTHAAAWAVIAACMLGRTETAESLFRMLDPIIKGNADNILRYGTEPYSVPGDVGGFGENLGRGGWTWYTGAAGWLYQAAVYHILGIRKEGDMLKLEPETKLDRFTIRYRFGSASYLIHAERGEGQNEMRLADDGKPHEVTLYYQ